MNMKKKLKITAYSKEYYEGRKKRGSKHPINIYIRDLVLYHTSNHGRGRLLEIGCAKGEFLKVIRNDFREVIGIDVSEYAIDVSKQALGKEVTFQWNIETGIDAPFFKNIFDVVVSVATFEHFHRPDKVLKYTKSLLTNNGYFFLLVPNPNSLKLKMARLFDRKNKYYFFDDPTHYSFFSRSTWEKVLEKSGFRILHSLGRPFIFPKTKFLLNLYNHGYYNTGILYETGPEMVFICEKLKPQK